MRQNKRFLQWVLDFVDLDLKSLSDGKKRVLTEDIQNLFFSVEVVNVMFKKIDHNLFLWPVQISFDEKQNKWIFLPTDDQLDEIQQELRSIMEWVRTVTDNPDNPVLEYSSFQLPNSYSYLEVEKGHFCTTTYWPIKSLRLYVRYVFIKYIDGLRIQSIRKCKGCGRYFVDLTDRKKVFCTPQCASRSIARMKREELRKNPKEYRKYLDQQQKYQSKHYEESQRAKGFKKVTHYKKRRTNHGSL